MTPKEKALELVDDMFNCPATGYNEHKIECALVAVDEIAKCTKYEKQQFENDRFSEDYWNEVKNEIEKL